MTLFRKQNNSGIIRINKQKAGTNMKINMDNDEPKKSSRNIPRTGSSTSSEQPAGSRVSFLDKLRVKVSSESSEGSILKKWWWLFLIIIVAIFFGVKGMTSGSNDVPKPATHLKKVANVKPIEQPKVKSTNTKDVTPVVRDFFTAYQIFDSKTNMKERQAIMLKDSNKSVVDNINSINPSLTAKTSDPVKVVMDAKYPQIKETGTGIYNVVLKYTMYVGKNSSKHTDTYNVVTAHNKITQVNQTNVDTE